MGGGGVDADVERYSNQDTSGVIDSMTSLDVSGAKVGD